MTNTRSTDPEIFERRYPVILRQFRLREGSGGRGQHRGGEGVVRELEFRRDLTCSILSERRGGYLPYGMAGGQPAKAGLNLWISTDPQGRDRVVNMGGKNTVPMKRGDRIMVMTPGGGGYGPEGTEEAVKERKESVFVGNGSYAERIALQHSN
jgi:5-oxoprolinase (ATP-hydrolysing)